MMSCHIVGVYRVQINRLLDLYQLNKSLIHTTFIIPD